MGWWSILKRAPERYTRASTRALSLLLLSLTFARFCGSFAFTASRWSESACTKHISRDQHIVAQQATTSLLVMSLQQRKCAIPLAITWRLATEPGHTQTHLRRTSRLLTSWKALAQSSVKRSAVPGSWSKGRETTASDSHASTTAAAGWGEAGGRSDLRQ